MKTSRSVSIVLLTCVMLIWGSTFVVTKSGLDHIPPILFAFLRLAVASISLLMFAAVTRQARMPRPIPWGVLCAMATSGIVIYYITFNLALRYTSASQAALVQSCVPVATALLAVIFLREPLTLRQSAGIVLAVAGVVMMFLQAAPADSAPRPWLGNLMMLVAVIAWAVYTILAKKIASVAPVAVTTYITLIGTGLLALPALIEVRAAGSLQFKAADWIVVAYLGIFPSALSFVFYSNALRELQAGQVATFVNLVPLVGVLAGVIVLGETLSSTALIGGALVLAGVWFSTHRQCPD